MVTDNVVHVGDISISSSQFDRNLLVLLSFAVIFLLFHRDGWCALCLCVFTFSYLVFHALYMYIFILLYLYSFGVAGRQSS